MRGKRQGFAADIRAMREEDEAIAVDPWATT
jgi:hypothetical protein